MVRQLPDMHYGTKRNGHGQVSSHVFYVFTILKLNLDKTRIVFPMIVISAAESKKNRTKDYQQLAYYLLSPGYGIPV